MEDFFIPDCQMSIGNFFFKWCQKPCVNQQGVFCEACLMWIHQQCAGLTRLVFAQTENTWLFHLPTVHQYLWGYHRTINRQPSLLLWYHQCSSEAASASLPSTTITCNHQPSYKDVISISNTSSRSISSHLPDRPRKPLRSAISIYFNKCRSLLPKMEDLHVLASGVSPPTIITLAETWLDNLNVNSTSHPTCCTEETETTTVVELPFISIKLSRCWLFIVTHQRGRSITGEKSPNN